MSLINVNTKTIITNEAATADVVVVTGDRHASTDQWFSTLSFCFDTLRPLVLIHGDADGIDSIADHAARVIGSKIQIERYPANWNLHGKRAGPLRNRAMVDRCRVYQDYGKRVIAIAMHPNLEESKGTKNMVRQLQAAKFWVYVIEQPLGDL